MTEIETLKLQVQLLQNQVSVLVQTVNAITSVQRADNIRLQRLEKTTSSNDQYIAGQIMHNSGR